MLTAVCRVIRSIFGGPLSTRALCAAPKPAAPDREEARPASASGSAAGGTKPRSKPGVAGQAGQQQQQLPSGAGERQRAAFVSQGPPQPNPKALQKKREQADLDLFDDLGADGPARRHAPKPAAKGAHAGGSPPTAPRTSQQQQQQARPKPKPPLGSAPAKPHTGTGGKAEGPASNSKAPPASSAQRPGAGPVAQRPAAGALAGRPTSGAIADRPAAGTSQHPHQARVASNGAASTSAGRGAVPGPGSSGQHARPAAKAAAAAAQTRNPPAAAGMQRKQPVMPAGRSGPPSSQLPLARPVQHPPTQRPGPGHGQGPGAAQRPTQARPLQQQRLVPAGRPALSAAAAAAANGKRRRPLEDLDEYEDDFVVDDDEEDEGGGGSLDWRKEIRKLTG